jgi:hypothetical protein
MDPKLRKRIKQFADQMVEDYLYFGHYEFDEDDVLRLAHAFKIDVKTVCKTLRIDIPDRLVKNEL